MDWLRALIDEGVAGGELEPLTEPHRFISLMGVATVFHFASRFSLTPGVPVDPASAAALERHKRETLRLARHMLGIGERAEESRGFRDHS